MKLKIYSIRDQKAEMFLQPFFAVNEAVAKRSFVTAAMDESHDFNRFSEDYSLWEIGEFDGLAGVVSDVLPTRCICKASDFDLVEKEAWAGEDGPDAEWPELIKARQTTPRGLNCE